HRHDGKDRQVVIGLEIDLGQIRLAHAHLVVRPQPQGIDDDKGQVGIVQRLQKGKGARGIVADQSVLAVPLKAQKPLFKPDDRFLGDFQRAKTGALNLHRRAPFTVQPAPQPNTEYRSPTTEMVIAAFCMRYARTAPGRNMTSTASGSKASDHRPGTPVMEMPPVAVTSTRLFGATSTLICWRSPGQAISSARSATLTPFSIAASSSPWRAQRAMLS